MDFSRPIERGDGNCAVSIPFVRRVIRYEMKRWTKEGVKKKKREKKGVETARVSFHIFETKDGLFLANEFESRNVSGRRIHLFRASSSNRKHKHLFTRLADEDDRLYIYIYIYLYPRSKFQAWKKRKEKKKREGEKEKFFSIVSLAAWQYSRIYLKRVESSRERESRQRTVALDEG